MTIQQHFLFFLTNQFSLERSPLLTLLMIVRGFTKVCPLNRAEALCLWPLVVLRASVLLLAVRNLLLENSSNAYLQDEVVQNEALLLLILDVPAASAIDSILLNCKHSPLNSPSVTPAALLALPLDEKVQELDLSCLSSSFENGEYFSETSVVTLLKKRSQQTASFTLIPAGLPWLLRVPRHSFLEPKATPTFTLVHPRSQHSLIVQTTSRILSDTVLESSSSESEEALRAVFGNSSDACSQEGHSVRETILLASDSSCIARILQIYSSPCLSALHPEGTLLAATASLNSEEDTFVCSLIQTLRLDTGHLQYHHPLIGTCSTTLSALPYLFPALFVTRFDWQQLWRPLSVALPCSSASAVTEFESLVRETVALRTDEDHSCLGALQEHYFDVDPLCSLPPVILRGHGSSLLADSGRSLIDLVNNVAVVGHSHPRITKVAHSQLQLLNTNSRFLYPGLGQFARDIISRTVPSRLKGHLNRVVFVNSGSEATDLALRIARTVVSHRNWKARGGNEGGAIFRWRRDVLCLQGGYHGVSCASDEVSTTLNDNPL